MRYGELHKKLDTLAAELPRGYKTFDRDGNVVIQSPLSGLDWYMATTELLRSKGHQKEKALLISQLTRSEGQDNSGGCLYELALALAKPYMSEPDPHVEDRFFKPFGQKVRKFSFTPESSAPRTKICDHKFVAGTCVLCRADIRET
jgi:hypothetical protein